jgi:hypothetical protein
MLENWPFSQLNQNSDDYIFQQDGAPPHFHKEVREVLNRVLQGDGSDAMCLMKIRWSGGHPGHRI